MEAHKREQVQKKQLQDKAKEVDKLLADAKEERQRAREAMSGWEKKVDEERRKREDSEKRIANMSTEKDKAVRDQEKKIKQLEDEKKQILDKTLKEK